MESNIINYVPKGKTPVYHLSQNDNGRTIRVVLTETLTGSEALTLRYLKLNGAIGAVAVPSTSGVNVDIDIPSSMTDIKGYCYCKLRVNGVGVKAFYIDIEGRP